MVDWDAESAQLTQNLQELLDQLGREARARAPLDPAVAKRWHARLMAGLDAPNPKWIGRFRGEPGAEMIGVRVGRHEGTPPGELTGELDTFNSHLKAVIEFLDEQIRPGAIPEADTLDAVIDVCGWVHAEWVRIHPFANGNGRTARLWANAIAMRYGLPPFVRLRPRPAGDDYARASAQAMAGDWRPTAGLFRTWLDEYLEARTGDV